jgi:hypothetical protein
MTRSLCSSRMRSHTWLASVLWMFASLQVALAQVPGASEWPNTNFENRSVDLSEIMSGGPPKDGIPAIDSPKFTSVAKASKWLDKNEPVIALTIEGEARAYPLQILIWHEIVNDEIGTTPVSVTFCPLCNSAIAFDRRIGGRVLDFGTSGRLRKSDMVMYDRQTESWWQQILGEGIVGEMTGKKLTTLPADIVAFGDFQTAYFDGKVLSRDTGHQRAYGQNPYRGYDSISDRPFLFFDAVDPRLAPMERVVNIRVRDHQKVYPFAAFKDEPVINDEVSGQTVVLISRAGTHSVLDTSKIVDGRPVPAVTAYQRVLDGRDLTFERKDGLTLDTETASTWNQFGQAVAGPLKGKRLTPANSGLHFAFAWLAFNPSSEIYKR